VQLAPAVTLTPDLEDRLTNASGNFRSVLCKADASARATKIELTEIGGGLNRRTLRESAELSSLNCCLPKLTYGSDGGASGQRGAGVKMEIASMQHSTFLEYVAVSIKYIEPTRERGGMVFTL
jgi:hypothetical protein